MIVTPGAGWAPRPAPYGLTAQELFDRLFMKENRWDYPAVRFWSQVQLSDTGCWVWTGPKNRDGYASFGLGKKRYNAHRLTYEWAKGPIPDGFHVDHLCHGWQVCLLGVLCPHRCCVRPSHLEAVPPSVNAARGWVSQAHRRDRELRIYCGLGHELTPENVYISPNGTRYCRECKNRNWREMYDRKKETRGVRDSG